MEESTKVHVGLDVHKDSITIGEADKPITAIDSGDHMRSTVGHRPRHIALGSG